MFAGIEGIARKVTGAHIGVDGVARKVKKAYVGVDGVARLAWEAGGESGRVRAYLYNGVKLPELPKWDKTAYPCVCITQNGSGVIACHIHQAVVYALTDRVVLTAPYKNYLLSSDGTTWEYQSGSTGTHDATFSPLIWTDTDAYNKDGTELILEASDPVPLYNYNGVELPELPERDKVKYPYTFITELSVGTGVYFMGDGWTLKENSASKATHIMFNDCALQLHVFNNGLWEEHFTYNNAITNYILWSDFDIIHDGEGEYAVNILASEPQPVYL